MKSDQVWHAALGELQLQMTQATFDTWLRGSRLLKYEDGTFVIGVKNGYAKDWLEHRLLATIKRTLARLTGRTVAVKFVVWNGEAQQENAVSLLNPATSIPAQTPAPPPANLNPRYIFDTFVVIPPMPTTRFLSTAGWGWARHISYTPLGTPARRRDCVCSTSRPRSSRTI